jgi:hypothetical protein
MWTADLVVEVGRGVDFTPWRGSATSTSTDDPYNPLMRTRVGRVWIVAVWVLVATACSGGTQQKVPTTATTNTTVATSDTSATGSVTAAAPHRFDYSNGPVVVLQPLPPLTDPTLPFAAGSVDYFDLFTPDAPWTEAAKRVDVFEVPTTWVRHYSTDEQVRTMIEGLASRGIALSLQLGPLPSPEASEGCTGGESYGGVYEIEMMQRIMDLGGTVDVISFDEPYAFGHKADGPASCQRPLEQIAAEAADFTRMARALNPNVIVGSIEPMWIQPEIGADDMAAWLDAYEAAAGEPFAFLHSDMDWTRSDWAQVARQVEAVADERDVPFGVIYFGGPQGTSDQTWIQLAAEHAYEFEQVAGGTPDDIPISSWEDYPQHTLPESDPDTLTGLIDRYFAPRTTLTTTQGAGASEVLSVAATLQTTTGEAVTDASFFVDVTPRNGQMQRQSATGRVPDGAVNAVAIIRVNTEAAGPGIADIRLYEATYSEDGGPNSLPEVTGWTAYGAGSGTFPASDHGSGTMLQLTAQPDQDLRVDSSEFPVTAGAAFEFDIDDSVPETSIGSGYIAVAFLGSDDLEISRTILPFEPAPQRLGTIATDPSGSGVADFEGLEAGRYSARLSYPGDLHHWPSRTDYDATVE